MTTDSLLPVVFDDSKPFLQPDAEPGALPQLERGALLEALDLSRPELAGVNEAYETGDRRAAMERLLEHFRSRPAVGVLDPVDELTGGLFHIPVEDRVRRAEDTIRHRILARATFLDLGYEAHDYGDEIDWDFARNGNIAWRACMLNFSWDAPLAGAYALTRDSRYVQAWTRITSDFVRKHRLAEMRRQPRARWGYGKQFAMDPSTSSVRLLRWYCDFELYRKNPAFTAEFLETFLIGVHDAVSRNVHWPEPTHHNFTFVQAKALILAGIVFPEFREATLWLERGRALFDQTVDIQVTPDGVQREWCYNYHIGCANIVQSIIQTQRAAGLEPTQTAIDRLEKMYDYALAAISPDRQYPMFGDARRPAHDPAEALRLAHELFNKPEYLAVFNDDAQHYPERLSYAFAEAGMYFLRSGWDRDAIYLALHCSPPARSIHDHADNGTFEVHAFGRWLMPDSGCYSYTHGTEESKLRPWFAKASSHQTMTLNDGPVANAARHRLWVDEPASTVVSVANDSSPGFTHQRTIWFVDRAFFVLLDEALGENVRGDLRLHFQLAAGPSVIDTDERTARTDFNDGANLLLWSMPDARVRMIEEEGWTSSQFHERTPRPAVALQIPDADGPARFVTVIVPYRDGAPPQVTATPAEPFQPGDDRATLDVCVNGRRWRLTRDLATGKAEVMSIADGN